MACREWEITVFCREEESTEAVVITVWSMGAGDSGDFSAPAPSSVPAGDVVGLASSSVKVSAGGWVGTFVLSRASTVKP